MTVPIQITATNARQRRDRLSLWDRKPPLNSREFGASFGASVALSTTSIPSQLAQQLGGSEVGIIDWLAIGGDFSSLIAWQVRMSGGGSVYQDFQYAGVPGAAGNFVLTLSTGLALRPGMLFQMALVNGDGAAAHNIWAAFHGWAWDIADDFTINPDQSRVG